MTRFGAGHPQASCPVSSQWLCTEKGLMLGLRLCGHTVLTFLIVSEQGILHFDFAPGPANYMPPGSFQRSLQPPSPQLCHQTICYEKANLRPNSARHMNFIDCRCEKKNPMGTSHALSSGLQQAPLSKGSAGGGYRAV